MRLGPGSARRAASGRRSTVRSQSPAAGDMTAAGLAQVEAARRDRRWEAAYVGPHPLACCSTDSVEIGSQPMAIFIFHDYVHDSAALYTALVARYGAVRVRYVNADDVANGILAERPAAFFRPGGASRYAAAKLRGRGYGAIRAYVQNGGTYVGICGGAYDACSQTRWAVDTPYEIVVENSLALFEADAIGPIREFCDPRNRDGSAAKLVALAAGERQCTALYWGGGRFVPHAGAEYAVQARFADLSEHSAAVVSGRFGVGRWLLCSPHLEYDHAALQLTTFEVPDNRHADIAALGDTTHVTLDLFHHLLTEFIG